MFDDQRLPLGLAAVVAFGHDRIPKGKSVYGRINLFTGGVARTFTFDIAINDNGFILFPGEYEHPASPSVAYGNYA